MNLLLTFSTPTIFNLSLVRLKNNTNGSYPSSMSSQPARRLTRVNTNYWRRSANPYTKSNWAEMSRRSARSYLLATVCVGTWICTVNRGVYFTWASQVSAVIVFLLRLAPVRQVVIILSTGQNNNKSLRSSVQSVETFSIDRTCFSCRYYISSSEVLRSSGDRAIDYFPRSYSAVIKWILLRIKSYFVENLKAIGISELYCIRLKVQISVQSKKGLLENQRRILKIIK